jgi:hypothetical protein
MAISHRRRAQERHAATAPRVSGDAWNLQDSLAGGACQETDRKQLLNGMANSRAIAHA